MGPSVAGLDLGSNTFSCAVLGRGPDGPVVLGDASVPVRLSAGLVPGGPLLPAAVERGLWTLERLARDFDLRGKPLRAVGTAALRMTADPRPFTAPASAILGAPVEIIDAEAEALLTARGALLGLPGGGSRVIIDIGGQSTEVCWTGPDDPWRSRSLPLGVVALTARLLTRDPPAPADLAALAKAVDALLEQGLPRDPPGAAVAVAGTATTLARLELGGGAFDRERIHGLGLDRGRVGAWLERVAALDAAGRTRRFGIQAGRADVFPAGLVILDRVLDHLGREEFVVSANGLRVGAALSIMREESDATRPGG